MKIVHMEKAPPIKSLPPCEASSLENLATAIKENSLYVARGRLRGRVVYMLMVEVEPSGPTSIAASLEGKTLWRPVAYLLSLSDVKALDAFKMDCEPTLVAIDDCGPDCAHCAPEKDRS